MNFPRAIPPKIDLAMLGEFIRRNSQPKKRPKKPVKIYPPVRLKTAEEKAKKPVPVRRPVDPKKVVYFIHTGDVVKIGVSCDVKRRLTQLKTGLSHPIKAVYVDDGRQFREASLHEKFKKHRLQGEWFAFSDEIKDFIGLGLKGALLTQVEP